MGLWSVAKLGWDGGRVKGHWQCLSKAGVVEGGWDAARDWVRLSKG